MTFVRSRCGFVSSIITLCCVLASSGYAQKGPRVTKAFEELHEAVDESKQKETDKESGAKSKLQLATFAGGCFWCTEAVFEEVRGVTKVVSGYSGSRFQNPSYRQVLTGLTGHAEVIQLQYDPEVISYAKLLEIFWRTHDPTTLNSQGPDKGTQYRSAIFYHNDEQRELAQTFKDKLNVDRVFGKPVVTEIKQFTKFYPAEKYHQNYYSLNRKQGYCKAIITPKLSKFRRIFRDELKKNKRASKKEKSEEDQASRTTSDKSQR